MRKWNNDYKVYTGISQQLTVTKQHPWLQEKVRYISPWPSLLFVFLRQDMGPDAVPSLPYSLVSSSGTLDNDEGPQGERSSYKWNTKKSTWCKMFINAGFCACCYYGKIYLRYETKWFIYLEKVEIQRIEMTSEWEKEKGILSVMVTMFLCIIIYGSSFIQ